MAKLPKLTKDQKHAIAEVVGRRRHSLNQKIAAYGVSALPGLAVGLVADLLFTAGFGTVTAICAGVAPAMGGILHASTVFGKFTIRSGQVLEGRTGIGYTVARIEGDLDAYYQKMHAGKVTIATVNEFLLAAEIAEKDVSALSHAFKIASGGKFNRGTEKARLMVSADTPLTDKRIYVDLEDAKKMAREKIHAIENPPPPPPPPAKKKVGFILG